MYRLRVIGFPLNLWVGSQAGPENRDSDSASYFLINFKKHLLFFTMSLILINLMIVPKFFISFKLFCSCEFLN
jgi:hypothetical protein